MAIETSDNHKSLVRCLRKKELLPKVISVG